MYRNYDPYGRRNGRSPHVTNIPGPARQRVADPVTEIHRLRQQLEQANNENAEWRQAAEKYHAIAKQQQAEAGLAEQKLAQMEQKLVALETEMSRKDAAMQREIEILRQEVDKKEIEVEEAVEKDVETAAEESEWQEKYTRLYAEFENSKKRLEQRFATEAKQNQEKLLRDMLPLADNLERAIEHADGDQSGLEMIQKAFLTAIARHGVEPIAAEEEPFNPELHEAIGMVPHPTAESGTIVSVAENGYTHQDSLLRPAKVLVAQ
jgi:molecular chaperone GrpE